MSKLLSKSELSSRIGSRIKQLRDLKGISQAELGRLCEKDRQHIELIENNKVSANIYTLYLISRALEINLDELFDFEQLDH
ncbi:MAG: helix-turn-helix transcriptional regulator [Crocinitomicaceae bacterium]|nr:helix-turn-helix transcriptional regulator [Crocinitomicaceae bacterium]